MTEHVPQNVIHKYVVPLDKFTKINWQVPPAVSAQTTLNPVEKPLFGLTAAEYEQAQAFKDQIGIIGREPNDIMKDIPFTHDDDLLRIADETIEAKLK